jgi:hypothetical protein
VIRVGLVGAGPWVGLFTAPMLASAADLTPAAVLARRTAAAEELAGRHGAAAVGSFDDLLAACDAVARQSAPGEVRQPLDVHHGVRLQRLVAAVDKSIGTGAAVVVDRPDG